MKVLFVCGGYYPDTSATGNCVKQIADMFTLHGHTVIIICKSGGLRKSTDIINRQRIYRITNLRLRSWYGLSRITNLYLRRVLTVIYKCFWAGLSLFSPDGLDNSLVKEYSKEINAIIANENIDAIIPCCMPAECLKATYICAQSGKTKVFPLLYDMYSGNETFFRYKWSFMLRRGKAESLEHDLFSISERVFYVDNWSAYFTAYPIANALKVEHPLMVKRILSHGELRKRTKINAIYQGEINHQMRPPTFMLNVFEGIVEKQKSISLHVCAYGNAVIEVEQSTKRQPNNIVFYGRVGKDVADELYDAADIAVVIANKNPNVVPSKIFECIASGYPIIYFYYTEEEKTYLLLQRYPLVYYVRQDAYIGDFIDNMVEWIETNYTKRLAYEDVSRDYSDATPDFVYEEIVKAIKEETE